MERLYIRGRILSLFHTNCAVEENAWQGEPAFVIDPDELSRLLQAEFGVDLSAARFPDLLTVNWLVDVVHELTSNELVM